MNRSAFTMVELIFVIVVIGILASVAVPKFLGMKDGAKKSAEMATFSALSTALQTANGEWSINEGSFTWGIHRPSSELNSTTGYPSTEDHLGEPNDPFNHVIKNSKKFKRLPNNNSNILTFTGPASHSLHGASYTDEANKNSDIPGKPDKNDFWAYALSDYNISCNNCNAKTLYTGDILLIDVNGTDPRPTSISIP